MSTWIQWLKWLIKDIKGTSLPDWKKRGEFQGVINLSWHGPLNYDFKNPDREFRFIRGSNPTRFVPVGDIIVPGDMSTDGGSIPRPFWSIPELDPWTFMPAYIIHDWLFEEHHRGQGTRSFEDANIILLEAVYTLMLDGVAPYSNFAMLCIADGVSSPEGQHAWDYGL